VWQDYASLIDLSGLFRVWNAARGQYTNFSQVQCRPVQSRSLSISKSGFVTASPACIPQDHCAKVWIGIEQRPTHNAMADATISMLLFNAYRSVGSPPPFPSPSLLGLSDVLCCAAWQVQWDPARLFQLQQATLTAPRVPGFSAVHPVIDGCW